MAVNTPQFALLSEEDYAELSNEIVKPNTRKLFDYFKRLFKEFCVVEKKNPELENLSVDEIFEVVRKFL